MDKRRKMKRKRKRKKNTSNKKRKKKKKKVCSSRGVNINGSNSFYIQIQAWHSWRLLWPGAAGPVTAVRSKK